ncbi:PK [Mytilus edulis]|uniref:PK n=1 Tax=Mytilus edulis TaxID=6550 RepID=A0A8S3V9P5_MYTED|nr:PK [Mytilus edulis]
MKTSKEIREEFKSIKLEYQNIKVDIKPGNYTCCLFLPNSDIAFANHMDDVVVTYKIDGTLSANVLVLKINPDKESAEKVYQIYETDVIKDQGQCTMDEDGHVSVVSTELRQVIVVSAKACYTCSYDNCRKLLGKMMMGSYIRVLLIMTEKQNDLC